ncbi:uncharacterized protein LOC129763145 [Toxorhynchites rutilus septentrionalis]|uniref:uncharacterized protein LOC129763145 n=1 Tax=Toxorhynchites rutilus septentrionalis TaxID=329112 RepID=UPI00247A83EA|nr:uncharacterized protein LOC129763145 [Toxorhynchites rutilus septentrionalis]
MPRKYIKTPGKRTYRNYAPENVEKAADAVRTEQLSIRQASKKFGVTYGTIFSKKNGLHTSKNGGQTMLSEAVEKDLTETIAGEWVFPLTKDDIQLLVRDYMEIHDIAKSSPSSPGKDWCYDSKEVVIRKGQNHADNILDPSKTSYSVMFAGAADGFVLPPYVVYATVHLYDTWADGGPKGTRYNRSKSGWFDKTIFEDWFFSMTLPYFQNLDNNLPKVIIGDNVASYLSYKVMKSCLENNIRFAFPPPNATHICQPLDVAYFRPLKQAWRTLGRSRIKDRFPSIFFRIYLRKHY